MYLLHLNKTKWALKKSLTWSSSYNFSEITYHYTAILELGMWTTLLTWCDLE